MAKKAFNDLSGVELTIEGREGKRRFMVSYDKNATIDYTGDIFYMIDEKNNFEIIPVVLKERTKVYTRRMIRYSKYINDTKSFIPGAYHSVEKRYNSSNVLAKIESFEYKGNRSHIGRFFTTEEEAKVWQKKFREFKVFKLLKKGDIVYCVHSETQDKPDQLVFDGIQPYRDERGIFHILFGDNGYITVGETIWEDKLSDQLDPTFYDYSLEGYDNVKLFVNEKDALKCIAETAQRKKKNATDKYIKSIENHDGKPISFSDKLGKPLHYGDTVAYAVSGGSSYPYLSFGKITGETKTRVNVEDIQVKDEKHCVASCCLLLIKEAEVNVNSGYSFVKA